MNKASVCMSIYNKNDVLPNVLYSLSQQKTTFPFEVCIVDDHSDEDPYPIIEEFLVSKGIPVKYQRLDQYEGFMVAYDLVLNMPSEGYNCMVLQSADVIYLEDDIIEQLCNNLSPHFFTMLEVQNLAISKDFYLNFEENKNFVLQNWNNYTQLRRQLLYYEGVKRETTWFFFLGAILKEDLKENYAVCDMLFNKNLHENRMVPIFINSHAVHQNHRHLQYECPLIKSCGICSRNVDKKTRAERIKRRRMMRRLKND